MSIWTNVCGCMRIDALRFNRGEQTSKIKEVLGRMVDFGDESYETTLPCGSEGSLHYQVIENPDLHNIAAYTVPIWGDLRDYDDVDAVVRWFYDCCGKLLIRNAVLNIEVEYGKSITVCYPKNTQRYDCARPYI